MVTYGLPYPPDSGPRIRDFSLLREISGRADVTVCSLVMSHSQADLSELRRHCEIAGTWREPQLTAGRYWDVFTGASLRGMPLATRPYYVPEMAAAIRSLVDRYAFDIVQFEHSFLAGYRTAIPPDARCRTVLSFHNVGFQQYRRMAALDTGWKARLAFGAKAIAMRGWESRAAAQFDGSIAVSAAERDLLLAENPALRIFVIENGVDCEQFRPFPQDAPGNALLFVGIMAYPPNRDAMIYFCRDILPLVRKEVPDVRLSIVGHSPPAVVRRLAEVENVTVTGYVEDVTPYYRDAAVLVVPLRGGGGTRLKILEAMSLGRPVVSTSIGCEGLEVISGRHLLVADTPEEFALSLVRLFRNSEHRRSIAAEARHLVEQRYDWKLLGGKLWAVYQELLSSG